MSKGKTCCSEKISISGKTFTQTTTTKKKTLVRNDYSVVIDFFKRDGISKKSPNKKDCMKIIDNEETIMKMKWHLKMTIEECYSLFKE